MEENYFLNVHKASIIYEFWEENYKEILMKQFERMYITEVIREWYVSDIVINGEKVLVKWKKRFEPLTEDELAEKYGR